LPDVNESVLKTIACYVLTDKNAIHLEASHDYVDQGKTQRSAGEKWLVTNEMIATYIPGVYETVIRKVKSITLSNRQWVKVINPWCKETKSLKRGQSEIRFGELTFFQVPGEEFGEKQSLQVLSAEQSMVLQAVQPYADENGVKRQPGEKWLKSGPGEYHPSTKVQVLETRFDLALDSTEGVYVRDTNTGEVRSVIGQNVTLSADEELWEKHMSPQLSELLNRKHDVAASRVVSYACGENEAVQIFDYKTNEQRVVFGPELIMLAPNEEFKV
jgi:major vault protein